MNSFHYQNLILFPNFIYIIYKFNIFPAKLIILILLELQRNKIIF